MVKTKKKRKARPPVEEAEVRRLGLESENWTAANAAIKTRMSMADLFKKYPELKAAWDRGRFLRNLRSLAGTITSVAEAAKLLGLENGQVLQAMIDEDEEVGELWNEGRRELYIEFKSALVEAAEKGKPAAIRAVEEMLKSGNEKAGVDTIRITIHQFVEITGQTR